LRAWVLVRAGVVGVLLLLKLLAGEDVARLQGRAEAAARASDWATALDLWRRINSTVGATGTTYLGEGRACLALGRAAQGCLEATKRAGKKHWKVSLRQHVSGIFLI